MVRRPPRCFTPEAVALTRWPLRTRRGNVVTVRETAGLSAKGQLTDVDTGPPQLVRGEHMLAASRTA